MNVNLKSADSIFKFSKITRHDWNAGAALFTLENMGALARKIRRGEDEVILTFIAEITAAYLMERGIDPPEPNYTPPVEQSST